MGASPFELYSAGADLEQAFRAAYDQAGWEDGHSYSGTISSKSGVVAISRTPLPIDAAYARARELMEGDDARACDKWGPACALPVTEATLRRRTRRARVSTDARYEYEATRALRATLDLQPGEVIETITLDDMPDLTFAVAMRTTEGKAVTRYRITGGYLREEQVYATLAEAKRAAKAMLADPATRTDALQIEAVRMREDGAPLVVAERTAKPRTVRATVTTVTPKAGTPVAGWLFFGYAPS